MTVSWGAKGAFYVNEFEVCNAHCACFLNIIENNLKQQINSQNQEMIHLGKFH